MTIEEKRELAETSIYPETLEILSNEEDKFIRWNVARNKNTSKETLDKLADDEDEKVRWNVARNKNTSKETLGKLADDEKCLVFYSVYINHKTSSETLLKIEKRKEICKKCKFNNQDYNAISCPYKFEHEVANG